MTRPVLKAMLFCMAVLLQQSSFAQHLSGKEKIFTHADSLRGMLTPFRTCYDVTYYDLNVDIDIENKSISGYNKIYFDAVSDFEVMQVGPVFSFENSLYHRSRKQLIAVYPRWRCRVYYHEYKNQ